MTQGWSGLALTYAAVQVPMAWGVVRNGGAWHKLLASPLVAAPLTAIVGASLWAAGPVLSIVGATPHGLVQTALAGWLAIAWGYAGGQSLAKPETMNNVHQRGTVISDRSADTNSRAP